MNTLLPTALGLIGPLGTTELIVLAILGILIFGKRLPEVGRSIGQGIIEFKKGLSGIDEEAEKAARRPAPPQIESRSAPRVDTPAQDASATETPSRPA